MPPWFLSAAAALALLNGIALWQFWADKQRARAGLRRIPESDLLAVALLGGSPGALLARQMFRHKTRKQPFSTRLWLIVILQAGAVAGWFLI